MSWPTREASSWRRGASAVAALAELARERHRFLTSGDAAGALGLAYLPALSDVSAPAGDPPDAAAASGLLRDAMAAVRRREVGAGTTLVGPHRDDLSLALGARPAGAYASRAQQRSVALALRLAEADLLRQRTGEAPILLLDDLFSELDLARREATAAALADTLGASPGTAQLLVTTADARVLPDALPRATARFRIAPDRVETDDAP